jgi:puromycin-sensitive aminopeptidase
MNDISTRTLDDGRKEVKFATTPIVSTYLIAFVVGELDMIETKTKDERKTLVRVFAPKGQANQGEFALGLAARTLEFFADYFAIAYPLPKMDLV